MHYHNAEIHLYESSIRKASSTTYGSYSFHRVDMLYACLLACQSFFNVYLTLPPSSFSKLSTLNFGQLAHALACIVELSFLEAPGWDLQHVRQTVDLSVLLGQLAGGFEEASRSIDPKGQMNGTDAFSRCARKLRRVKGWYDTKLTTEPAEGPQVLMNASQMEGLETGGQFNFLDDPYWQEIMG